MCKERVARCLQDVWCQLDRGSEQYEFDVPTRQSAHAVEGSQRTRLLVERYRRNLLTNRRHRQCRTSACQCVSTNRCRTTTVVVDRKITITRHIIVIVAQQKARILISYHHRSNTIQQIQSSSSTTTSRTSRKGTGTIIIFIIATIIKQCIN